MFGLCECRSCENCGRDFAKLWVCSDVTLTVCGVGFVSISIWQVWGVGGLLVGVGVMVNVSTEIFCSVSVGG